jgi:hypothetical protein
MAKIFISYAREDAEMATRVYEDLRRHGHEPWIDERDLLPGERWSDSIKKAIHESAYVLALMSKNSVNKKGYVQKELREAIDVLDGFPEGEVFLIPARLDNCVPSHKVIREVNWVDLFPVYETGFGRILEAIKNENHFNAQSPESVEETEDSAVRLQLEGKSENVALSEMVDKRPGLRFRLGLAVAFVLLIVATLLAMYARNSSRRADAQRIIAQAINLRDGSLDLSLLLSLENYQRERSH